MIGWKVGINCSDCGFFRVDIRLSARFSGARHSTIFTEYFLYAKKLHKKIA